MKTLFLSILIFLAFHASGQHWEWAKKINSISPHWASDDIALDESGNFYIASSGFLNGQVVEIFIQKYNADGVAAWNDLITVNPAFYPGKIKSRNNQIYLVGSDGLQSVFIDKYDINGIKTYLKSINCTGKIVSNDFYIDEENNIYITGSFVGGCYFSDTITTAKSSVDSQDIFIAKFNNSGDLVFFKQGWSLDSILNFYVSQNVLAGTNIIANSKNEIIVTAKFNKGLIIDSFIDSTIVAEGTQLLTFQIDSAGNIASLFYPEYSWWTMSSSYGNFILSGNDDFYFIQGSWSAHADVSQVKKYNSANDTLIPLIKAYGDDIGGNYINGFCLDSDENIYVIGKTFKPYPNSEIWLGLKKYDSEINLIWKDSIYDLWPGTNYGYTFWSGLAKIIGDNNGNLFVLGVFADTLIIKNDTLISMPNRTQWFVAKINDILSNNETSDLKQEVSIFPNPTAGIFTIESSEPISSIIITNLIGETVYSSSKINSSFIELDISFQPQGVYFLEIASYGKKEMKKIIIQ